MKHLTSLQLNSSSFSCCNESFAQFCKYIRWHEIMGLIKCPRLCFKKEMVRVQYMNLQHMIGVLLKYESTNVWFIVSQRSILLRGFKLMTIMMVMVVVKWKLLVILTLMANLFSVYLMTHFQCISFNERIILKHELGRCWKKTSWPTLRYYQII